MATEPQLPSLRKGGDQVALTTTAVVGAVIDFFAPVAGTAFAQAVSQMLRSRFESAQEILLDEMKKGNLDVLKQDEAEAFVPMAFRFLEAAREGERSAVLKRYARIISSGVVRGGEVPSKFVFYSKLIEGLDEKHFIVLDRFVRFVTGNSKVKVFDGVGPILGFQNNTIRFIVPDEIGGRAEFEAISAILAGRGLLVGKADVGLGGGDVNYTASMFAIQLDALCRGLGN